MEIGFEYIPYTIHKVRFPKWFLNDKVKEKKMQKSIFSICTSSRFINEFGKRVYTFSVRYLQYSHCFPAERLVAS